MMMGLGKRNGNLPSRIFLVNEFSLAVDDVSRMSRMSRMMMGLGERNSKIPRSPLRLYFTTVPDIEDNATWEPKRSLVSLSRNK